MGELMTDRLSYTWACSGTCALVPDGARERRVAGVSEQEGYGEASAVCILGENTREGPFFGAANITRRTCFSSRQTTLTFERLKLALGIHTDKGGRPRSATDTTALKPT